MPSAITISIDLELGWGNWDDMTPDQLVRVETLERDIASKLIEIFDRHQVPATWAFVAALLDPKSAVGRPGPEHCWYAPDVIDKIRAASVSHDIGSHGGRHAYLDRLPRNEADEDFEFAAEVHKRHGLTCQSFVFPRNRLGDISLLARHGYKVFRGQDKAWHERIRTRSRVAGRLANLADKLLPIAPEAVQPRREGDLIDLPGSMLFMSRNGLRKLAHPAVIANKLESGTKKAMRDGGVFHLWFHPSNFYFRADSQFQLFESFVARAAKLAGEGRLSISPMAAFATS
jgi:hypothetical protein